LFCIFARVTHNSYNLYILYSPYTHMHITLDNILDHHHRHVEQTPQETSSWWSLKVFAIVFVVVMVVLFIITNATLIGQTLWLQQPKFVQSVQAAHTIQVGDINTIHEEYLFSKESLAAIPTTIQQRKIAQPVDHILAQETKNYDFDFSLLPPVNRLVIPSIWLDVPLISNTHKDYGDFVDGDFDSELREWVVKYPSTPVPGQQGNTMFFGHTSQERWERNPYGTVFSNLPKLQAWDEIQVVYDGELHTYKVLETVVRRPRDVEAEFQKRQAMDKDILTLMWCYPLGTTKQRMMVMAERID